MPMGELSYLKIFGEVEILMQNHKVHCIFHLVISLFLVLICGNLLIENSYYDWAVIGYSIIAIIILISLLNKQGIINIGNKNYVEVQNLYEYRYKEKYKLSDDVD